MCVFCKIVKGEIPCYKIYEDNDFLAFLDISQATIGHTLVIPKKHYESIFDFDNKEIFNVVMLIAKKLKTNLSLEGLNVLNNNGEIAGQSVNHFHIHLIPRYKDDNLLIKFSSNNLTNEEFNTLLQKIKA